MIRHATSQPNWKFTRLSSIDHDEFVCMNSPSLVSPRISCSVPSPGSRWMFVMRIKGMFCQPSARAVPFDGRPSSEAVSRFEMKFSNTPSTMIGTRWAGTPSSSYPYVPRPPGVVASAVMLTLSLAYFSLPRSSGRTNDVPAYASSWPSTRSSSAGWPTDSWTCSTICPLSSTSVVISLGQSFAFRRSTASFPMRSDSSTRPRRPMCSHPAAVRWPRNELG